MYPRHTLVISPDEGRRGLREQGKREKGRKCLIQVNKDCAVLPVSYIVRTFHVTMVIAFLEEMMIVGLAASRWTCLSLPGVIGLCARGPSTPQAVVSLGMRLGVSVAVQWANFDILKFSLKQ